MATFLAGAVVWFAAVYFLAFGVVALIAPGRASLYLRGFASSLRLHVLELSARLGAGAAFIGYASHMRFGAAFHVFGLVLVVTTLGLALLPWRWHQRFARASVPAAERHLPSIGIASIAVAGFVCWAVVAS